MYKHTKNNTIHNKQLLLNKKVVIISISGLLVASLGILSVSANSTTNSNMNDNSNSARDETSHLDDLSLDSPVFERINTTKTLKLASVQGDSTYFAADGFEHGFGYDLSKMFVDDLEVKLILQTYATNKEALEAVKLGKADIALTTASNKLKYELNLASINLGCGGDAKLTDNGLHPKVSWTFANPTDLLSRYASHYICDDNRQEYTSKLASFYSQNVIKDEVSNAHFKEALIERLPKYKSSFQKHARNHNHDWELLVAIGYQESHLVANATSPTGVRGIMMLTNGTAEEVGVDNRLNPHHSIRGGAEYFSKMEKKFSDVPKIDRTWFALAAYNMGPYAVKDIQKILKTQGKDETSWANVYAYMLDNQASKSRYTQCMHYVSNIRSYLEAIKNAENI